MKKLLKKLFAFIGFDIHRTNLKNSKVPYNDAFKMQKYLTKQGAEDVLILDVGAYYGTTALTYKKLFPKSRVFSFEPFPDSFKMLVKNTVAIKDITPINKGLGAMDGFSKFNSNRFAPTNSLLDSDEASTEVWGKGLLDTSETIDIELTTIDNFVETYKIEIIDILKMDVQGAEYLVLNGAKEALRKGIINMIYTEIITLPTYKGQLSLDEMIKQMKSYGFDLYNFYNPSLTNEGALRQVDVIFLKST